jgi:peptide/nickel transport system permease protein
MIKMIELLVRSRKFIIGSVLVLAVVLLGVIGPMFTRDPQKQFNRTELSNATASFSSNLVALPENGTATSTLTISTKENTPRGIYSITINGTYGSKVKRYTYILNVTPLTAPDLDMVVTPSSASVVPGESTTATVTLTSIAGLGEVLNDEVYLTASNLPQGVTASFSPYRSVPSFESKLTISTNENTPHGIYSITIQGKGTRKIRDYTFTLTVEPVENDFGISVTPLSESVTPGGSTTMTVTLTSVAGFSGDVSLSVSGMDTILINRVMEPPSTDFVLGTDDLGRDMFARLCAGTRSSLLVGIFAGAIATLIAILLGGIGPYKGGWADEISNAFTTLFLVFPMLPLLMLFSLILEQRSLLLVSSLIGLFSWPWAARCIRSQVLTLKEREFINMARMSGMKDRKVVITEIMPNMLAYIIIVFVVSLSIAVLTEAGLSMIGLGPPETKEVTLGNILYFVLHPTGTSMAWNMWWCFVPPGIVLTVFLIGVFIMHAGMDEVFNPRLRKV